MATVEICIPCYNAGRYIADAIDSIKRQSFQDYEVLVIDDGSTDLSVEIVQKYMKEDSRIKLISNHGNYGECYTRNRAIRESDAKYIAFLDADDIMPENRLDIEVDFLRKHPECDIVSGGYRLLSEEGEKGKTVLFGELSSAQIAAAMLFQNVIAIGSSMINKEFIIQNNLAFDEAFLSLGDYNFWVDCILASANIHILNKVLQEYRVVQTGLSRIHSAPDKIMQRNRNFDMIHSKMLSYFQISMNEKERRVFCEFTNEIEKGFCIKLKNVFILLKVLKMISKNGNSVYLKIECDKFRKRIYHI